MRRANLTSRSPGIRTVLLVSIAGGLLLIMGSGYLLGRYHMQKNIKQLSYDELSIYGEVLRENIVHMMAEGANDAALEKELAGLKEESPSILSLRLLHVPIITRQYGRHLDEEPRNADESKALASGETVISDAFNGDETKLLFVHPFRARKLCLNCHEGVRVGDVLGAFSMVVDMSETMQHEAHSRRDMLVLSLGEAFLLFVMFYLLLDQLILKRLQRLQAGVEQMAEGDLQVQIEAGSDDELGRVMDAFNEMAARQRALMGTLDQDIREQSEQLGHMVEISQMLGTSRNLDEILRRMVASMAESVKVTYARIFLLGMINPQQFHEVASHPLHPLDGSPPGRGLLDDCPHLDQALRDGEPLLLHAADVDSIAERELLFFAGTQWVLCLPVIHQSKPLGIVLLNECRSEEREPVDDRKMHYAMALTQELAAAVSNARLNDQVVLQLEEASFALADAVDKKSAWTSGHSHRVAEVSRHIGQAMGLSHDDLALLYRAGLLHDIGKIGTPGSILNKEGELTPEEYAMLQRHPADGAEILGKMSSFQALLPIIRYHHEHFDGNGYPDGLAGEEIPLLARIVAVADAYDAMTSDRPYRPGMTTEEAVRRILAGTGSQFDPQVVEVLQQVKLE